MKTVFFAGRKIRRLEKLVDEFRRLFRETRDARAADYVVHVDREGASALGDLVGGSNPRSIAVVANPLGINRWNGSGSDWELVRITIGSLSPDKCVPIPRWDDSRWEELCARHRLPRVDDWVSRPEDSDVVVLLPKLGGWLGLSDGAFRDRYVSVMKDVRAAHPLSRVVCRAHPRNGKRQRGRFAAVAAELSRACENVVIDTSARISQEQFDRTKLAVCDWSTAAYQFVMRGIPVHNPDRANPGRLLCAGACGGGASVREVMNEVCQSVVEVSDPSCLAEILAVQLGGG